MFFHNVKCQSLETVRNLTPDKVLFSPAGRFKIALLQLIAWLLPGRFAVWLSLLDEARLERQVRIKFGLRSLVPGSSGYDVPRLHLIVERGDWLALQDDALRAIEQTLDSSPSPQKQRKSGLTLKPIFDLLRRLDRDLPGVRGRIRINILESDHTRTLTLALNDGALRLRSLRLGLGQAGQALSPAPAGRRLPLRRRVVAAREYQVKQARFASLKPSEYNSVRFQVGPPFHR